MKNNRPGAELAVGALVSEWTTADVDAIVGDFGLKPDTHSDPDKVLGVTGTDTYDSEDVAVLLREFGGRAPAIG